MPDLITTNPVIVNSILAIVAGAVTPYLLKLGFDKDGIATIFTSIGALATAVLSGWAVVRARSLVTPLAAPKTNEGVPLTPPGQ